MLSYPFELKAMLGKTHPPPHQLPANSKTTLTLTLPWSGLAPLFTLQSIHANFFLE